MADRDSNRQLGRREFLRWLGTGGAALTGGHLMLGCQPMTEEVVKLLPEPPVYTLPSKPKKPAVAQTPPKKKARPRHAGAGWIPPGGISKRWHCIVVHHSATPHGSAAEFHQAHLNRGWDELGYHFVIGNGTGSSDGEIEVGSRWYKQKHGAHCRTAGNYHNEHGIGICLVGNFERAQPTPRQLASLEKLIRFLMAQCHIPARRVIGHREAPGASTACPGRNMYVRMSGLRSSLSQYAKASDF